MRRVLLVLMGLALGGCLRNRIAVCENPPYHPECWILDAGITVDAPVDAVTDAADAPVDAPVDDAPVDVPAEDAPVDAPDAGADAPDGG